MALLSGIPTSTQTLRNLNRSKIGLPDSQFRFYNRESSITAILGNLNWESLRDRRTKSRLTSIYKETHGLTPNNIKEYINSCTGTTTKSSIVASIHINKSVPTKTVTSSRYTPGPCQSGIYFPETSVQHLTLSHLRLH